MATEFRDSRKKNIKRSIKESLKPYCVDVILFLTNIKIIACCLYSNIVSTPISQ